MKPQANMDVVMLGAAFEARSPEAPERARLMKARYSLMVERAVVEANRICAEADRYLAIDEASGPNGAWAYAGAEGDAVVLMIDKARRAYDDALVALAAAAPWQDAITAIEAVEKAWGTARLYKAGSGMTPEMAIQRMVAPAEPVTALHALGHIDDDQRSALREIAALLRHITSAVGYSITYLPTAIEGGSAAAREGYIDSAEWYGLLHAKVYVPWSRRDPLGAALAVGVAHEGVSLSTLRTRHRMRWSGALDRLVRGLDLYNTMRGRYMQVGEEANDTTGDEQQ